MSHTDPPTDRLIDTDRIAHNAAEKAHGAHRGVWAALIGAVLVMLAVLYVSVSTFNRQNELTDQQSSAARAAQALQGQVLALGAKPVTSAPTPITGAPGPTGPAGRGISSTHIVAGDLYVVYTDGESVDVGRVLGAGGATGPTGNPGTSGRGITGTTISSTGDLVLTYSDGSSSNVGHVVGTAGIPGAPGPNGPQGTPGAAGAPGVAGSSGCSVASVGDTGGTLTVTYGTESGCGVRAGTTVDVGQLPSGPAGQPPVSWVYTDRLGGQHTCSQVPDFDPGNPRYTCS